MAGLASKGITEFEFNGARLLGNLACYVDHYPCWQEGIKKAFRDSSATYSYAHIAAVLDLIPNMRPYFLAATLTDRNIVQNTITQPVAPSGIEPVLPLLGPDWLMQALGAHGHNINSSNLVRFLAETRKMYVFSLVEDNGWTQKRAEQAFNSRYMAPACHGMEHCFSAHETERQQIKRVTDYDRISQDSSDTDSATIASALHQAALKGIAQRQQLKCG
ncbi:MAG: hypothetical protein M3O22_00665 [Pseudomonadota bacterium]|nr:hypothetical protein [Pseudomonadota bacterium]